MYYICNFKFSSLLILHVCYDYCHVYNCKFSLSFIQLVCLDNFKSSSLFILLVCYGYCTTFVFPFSIIICREYIDLFVFHATGLFVCFSSNWFVCPFPMCTYIHIKTGSFFIQLVCLFVCFSSNWFVCPFPMCT